MTRQLSFKPGASGQPESGPLLRLTTQPEVHAERLARDGVMANLRPALAVFAALDGTALTLGLEVTGAHEFTIPLTTEVAAQPWRLAILILLIDNLVSGSDDPGISHLLKSVEIEADGAVGLTQASLLGALEARKASADAAMTHWLPATFELAPPYVGRVFLVDGREWIFDLIIHPAGRFAHERATTLLRLIEDLDSVMAWTGFEVDLTPSDVLSNGLVPYPTVCEVKDGSVRYGAEMPPSGCGLMFDLMIALVVAASDAPVTTVDIAISRGW